MPWMSLMASWYCTDPGLFKTLVWKAKEAVSANKVETLHSGTIYELQSCTTRRKATRQGILNNVAVSSTRGSVIELKRHTAIMKDKNVILWACS